MEVSDKNVKELNERLDKLTSFKFVFISGILSGVGNAIGATIIAAILLTVLSQIIRSLGGVPYLQNLINRLK